MAFGIYEREKMGDLGVGKFDRKKRMVTHQHNNDKTVGLGCTVAEGMVKILYSFFSLYLPLLLFLKSNTGFNLVPTCLFLQSHFSTWPNNPIPYYSSLRRSLPSSSRCSEVLFEVLVATHLG